MERHVDQSEPEAKKNLAGLPIRQPSETDCSLRAFIQSLEEAGSLQRVAKAVDWNLEIGRMSRQCGEPLLFENISGYPGWRLFTNGLCDWKSIAIAVGIEPKQSRKDFFIEVRRRIRSPRKPEIVDSAPFLAESRQSETNLLSLPVPYWNVGDGGRYLGTWHINVTQDPSTGVRNVGVYRMHLLDGQHAAVSASPNSHLARHFAAAEKRGLPLPMAVAIGVPESVLIAAGAAFPEGADEYELAGALQQKALTLAQCNSVDLEVPADSEIVIEGFIRPGKRVPEGPFLDYAGEPEGNGRALLFEATRLMCRKDPIFRGAMVGSPAAEDHQVYAFLAQLDLLDFHGSRLAKRVQVELLKHCLFRCFQLSGRLSHRLGSFRRRSASLR